MHYDALLAALYQHETCNATEEKYRLDTISFVSQFRDQCWQRSTLAGHITASAFVLNKSRSHALLLHHAKLDRWLQPGGHIDANERFPYESALREAREETGLSSLSLASTQLFDIDIHRIPARGADPAHLHYDVRFLIIAADESVALSEESLGFKWLPLEKIAHEMEPSLARMAQKSLHASLRISDSPQHEHR